MLNSHQRNQFTKCAAGVEDLLPVRQMKALKGFARDRVLAQQSGFRPEAAEYTTDCAGGLIYICQQVSIFSQTEIVDMVGGHGDFPDGANRTRPVGAIQADNTGAADGVPPGELFDWPGESQRLLKQKTTLRAVIALINREFKAPQKLFDGDGLAVEKHQAVAIPVIAHQIGAPVTLLRIGRLPE